MRVPFVDLAAQYRAHRSEFDDAMRRVIERTAFIGGEFVKEFEDSYARAYGVKHCIPVANGTDAIYIALKMLDLGPGDEVITTAGSWISTSEAISQTGATPVFVDVDEFYNIDADLVEAKITSRTKAILPVHLYGQAARLDRLADISRRNNLLLVEDCAQAHFAEFDGKLVGTVGNAGTFSFYPGKNLGAYGDAGAIVTNDDSLARRCRIYANHGALRKHEHEKEGINSRLDGLQAALLTSKLRHIHDWTQRRQNVAAAYDRKLIEQSQVVVPLRTPGATHVFHLYVVRVPDRDALKEHLAAAGIETAIHYPTPLPFLAAYEHMNHIPADFPRAYSYHKEILSLPIFPEMTQEMVEYVCRCIQTFYA